MTIPSPSEPDREQALDALLAEYLRQVDERPGMDPEAFIQAHPDYAEDLRDLLDTASVIETLAGPRLVELPPEDPERTQQMDTSKQLELMGNASLETLASAPGSAEHASSETLPRPFRQFGDYQLLQLIGRGGMGVVYLARQQSLDRIVAIKMIRSGGQATDEDIRRFIREAQAAARLQHPHIVDIFEIGEIDGEHFFSMEFVSGQDLSRNEIRSSLSCRQIAEHVKTVAWAIEHAHRNQIIHRDLKPANIIIDEYGQPRVTDFGLAKDTRRAREMAKQGFSVGTPAYMSPEQAAANDDLVGPASDIYSLGAVLYALLVNRPPFRSDTAIDTLVQVIHETPTPPSDIDPSVDRRLEAICMKCLRKEPKDRYESAAELADDLDRYLQDQPLRAVPATLPIRVWYWLRDVPIIAAFSGRPVRSATLAQRIFQFVVPVIVILALFLLRSQGCHNMPSESEPARTESTGTNNPP